MDNRQLFEKAIDHRTEHGCSAYPYEEYEKLIDYIAQYHPQNILEIGTGMGFTALVMAKSDLIAQIDTIEKDEDHCKVARSLATSEQVIDRVRIIQGNAEQEMFNLQSNYYDFIFFDGYQIHYEFLPHYEKLLKHNGILFLANNHLKSKTSEQFFEELTNSGKWQILEKFADTTIAKKIN